MYWIKRTDWWVYTLSAWNEKIPNLDFKMSNIDELIEFMKEFKPEKKENNKKTLEKLKIFLKEKYNDKYSIEELDIDDLEDHFEKQDSSTVWDNVNWDWENTEAVSTQFKKDFVDKTFIEYTKIAASWKPDYTVDFDQRDDDWTLVKYEHLFSISEWTISWLWKLVKYENLDFVDRLADANEEIWQMYNVTPFVWLEHLHFEDEDEWTVYAFNKSMTSKVKDLLEDWRTIAFMLEVSRSERTSEYSDIFMYWSISDLESQTWFEYPNGKIDEMYEAIKEYWIESLLRSWYQGSKAYIAIEDFKELDTAKEKIWEVILNDIVWEIKETEVFSDEALSIIFKWNKIATSDQELFEYIEAVDIDVIKSKWLEYEIDEQEESWYSEEEYDEMLKNNKSSLVNFTRIQFDLNVDLVLINWEATKCDKIFCVVSVKMAWEEINDSEIENINFGISEIDMRVRKELKNIILSYLDKTQDYFYWNDLIQSL